MSMRVNNTDDRYNVFTDQKASAARDSHLASLDKFIAANPVVHGIYTADFRDFLSEVAGLESTYNKKARASTGYGGYYGIYDGDKLSDDDQHKAAFKHLSHLFNHVITDDDLRAGQGRGYTPAQILYKYWNQENQATEFLQNGDVTTIGDNVPIADAGWNMTSNVDYSGLVQKAITEPYYVIQGGDSFSKIQRRVRVPGRHYNVAGKDLVEFNSDILGVDSTGRIVVKRALRPQKDTLWFGPQPAANTTVSSGIPGMLRR